MDSMILRFSSNRNDSEILCWTPITGQGQKSGTRVVTEDNVQVNLLSLVFLLLTTVYNSG